MVFNKKNFTFFFLFIITGLINAHNPYGFRSKISRLSAQTLATSAQTIDYLLYPFVCWAAGNIIYKNMISQKLPNAPEIITSVEEYLPGKDTARTGATHLAVGAALFVGLKSLARVESIREFIQTNMPHLFQILSYIETKKDETSSTCEENSPKVYDAYMNCR